MRKDYILIKDHGYYKKGEAIKLHPNTAEVMKKHGIIQGDKKKRTPKKIEE